MKVITEISDEQIVALLLELIENCESGSGHPEDEDYARKFKKAATFVIKHCGG